MYMTARTLTETFFKRKQKKMWLALGYGLMNYYRAGEKKMLGGLVCVCVYLLPKKYFSRATCALDAYLSS